MRNDEFGHSGFVLFSRGVMEKMEEMVTLEIWAKWDPKYIYVAMLYVCAL